MIFNNNNKIVSLKNNSSYVSTLSDATGTIFNSIKYTKTFYKGFSYKGSIDIESLPAGRYFFECVGGGVNNEDEYFNYNAYVWVECLFPTQTTIHICCGGASTAYNIKPSYNGGGVGYGSGAIAYVHGDNGAGATHISLSYGLLNDGVVRNNLICAAGGAGGLNGKRNNTSNYIRRYSNGGGETGELTPNHDLHMVGTQTTGGGNLGVMQGSAGVGGQGIRYLSYTGGGGGGGGGWYGGGGQTDNDTTTIRVSGGGGSGKIGTVSQVVKGGMIPYGEEGYIDISSNGYDSQVNIYTLTPQI